jgi:hypothetical protein
MVEAISGSSEFTLIAVINFTLSIAHGGSEERGGECFPYVFFQPILFFLDVSL